MKPFEQLGYGMMKAILDAEALAAPAPVKRSAKRRRADPRQLPLAGDQARREVNDIEAQLARRRHEAREKARRAAEEDPEPTDEEAERQIRASQIDPAERQGDEDAGDLIDSTFMQS